jgi:hypothetical protein
VWEFRNNVVLMNWQITHHVKHGNTFGIFMRGNLRLSRRGDIMGFGEGSATLFSILFQGSRISTMIIEYLVGLREVG